MKIWMLTAVAVSLAGCAGINEAMTKYGDTDPVTYRIDGSTWRIFDQPENGRMMITTGVGTAGATGAKQGVTFGLANNPYETGAAYQPAATAYLAPRGCKITGGHLVLPMQYEFEYAC
ncbi:hypothetical protein PL335_06255 [Sulfitobacter faviae]|uniref:hypothetical protein n=1 Tax=Sulfitobacter faviae TaxID=1775881 RepID=UPI00230818B3|nr:hypothetical protein [Sulfitobacter faviae]WCE67945.1 hypothetical protein PL335_06255 [Sulfitobacter faviae]